MNFQFYHILLPLSLLRLVTASLQSKWLLPAFEQSPAFPNLIDATLADLSSGMRDRLFTSVDLTKVGDEGGLVMPKINTLIGVHHTDTRSELGIKRRHRGQPGCFRNRSRFRC